MNEIKDKCKSFDTWDEAFRGLAPVIRQQSVRIAAYTKAIYIKACELKFAEKQTGSAERMQITYAELAYKCGMYHQLGKALVPQEYQILEPHFTKEEIALYKKYTTEGRRLVAELQEKSLGTKRREYEGEPPTENIPWLMIRESCQQHMERFDGTGYPDGRLGSDISPIAQIVGMAKMFDHLSAEIKSENPFSEAYDVVLSESGKAFSPELCEIFKACRANIQSIYNKFIHYTMKIPRTIPLVKKTQGRPMGLSYRAMTFGTDLDIKAYEAIPWFKVNGDEKQGIEEIAPCLKRTNLTVDMSFYLLYEAADTLLRIQNCDLGLKYLLVQMLPDFYTRDSHLKRFEELFANQPIDRARLLLTIPEEVVLKANKGELEVISRYLKNGIELLLDSYHPEAISPARLKELGFSHVRLSPETSAQPIYASDIRALQDRNITVFASCAEHQHLKWLSDCGVYAISSHFGGEVVDEDTLIRDTLLRERVIKV